MASDSGDGHATLKRCLGVLRDAKNDSEQFAALLLVRNRGIAKGRPNSLLDTGAPGGAGRLDWELGESCSRALGFPSAKRGSLALTWLCGGSVSAATLLEHPGKSLD